MSRSSSEIYDEMWDWQKKQVDHSKCRPYATPHSQEAVPQSPQVEVPDPIKREVTRVADRLMVLLANNSLPPHITLKEARATIDWAKRFETREEPLIKPLTLSGQHPTAGLNGNGRVHMPSSHAHTNGSHSSRLLAASSVK